MAGLIPKVFEEANLSGELKLSGRKLKDFPKTAAKYNLSDTVIAGKKVHIFVLSIFKPRLSLQFQQRRIGTSCARAVSVSKRERKT